MEYPPLGDCAENLSCTVPDIFEALASLDPCVSPSKRIGQVPQRKQCGTENSAN